jgi:uncharacterized protein YegP (UPF0339 family)
MAKFTVYSDKHNGFRWKFHASNGVVVAKSGASFNRQEDCLASLNLFQKDMSGAPVGYQLRKGVHPATAVKPSAPVVASAPSTMAHPAGKVHAAASASPAEGESAPITASAIPAAPSMTAAQFTPPPN